MSDPQVETTQLFVGYPYQCIQDFTPAANQPRYSAIRTGTQGKVTLIHKRTAHVTMIHHDPLRGRGAFRTGWVPLNNIQVSTRRKYGDLEIVIPVFARITSTGAPGPHLGQGTQLRRAYQCLFEELNANSNQLKFARTDILERISSSEGRNRLVNIIMAGIPSSVAQVLNRSNFTILQLNDALTPVEQDTCNVCVYTIIYRFMRLARGVMGHYKLPEQYVGKSVEVQRRNVQHLRASRSLETYSPHYASANEAKDNRVMGCICNLTGQDNATLLAVEQANVLLFDTYNPDVKDFGRAPQEGQDVASTKAKYHEDGFQAQMLSRIARKAFQRSGWPLYGRGQGVPPYGAGPGKNWRSPIADDESWDRIQWVKQPVPELGLSLYWRKSLNAIANRGGSRLTIFHEPSKAPGSITEGQFSVWLGTDPPAGTLTYVVFELMDNGRPHPMNYSRLPDVGAWTGWDEARSFAVRVEWEAGKDNWKSKYVFNNQTLKMRPGFDNIHGAINTFAQCFAVARHMKQQRLDPATLPPFMFNYGIMRVKEQRYRHMEQIMEYIDLQPTSAVTPSPARLPWDQVVNTMRTIGLHAGYAWGQFDYPCNRPRFPAGACDSCHLLNIAERQPPPADYQPRLPSQRYYTEVPKRTIRQCIRVKSRDGTPDRCQSCIELGRICSWTTGIHYSSYRDPLVAALRPYVDEDADRRHDVGDPGIRSINPNTVTWGYD